MEPFSASAFFAVVAPYLVTIVVALIGWGLTELTRFIRSKTNNERIIGVMSVIRELVDGTVADLENTVRPMLSDGRLSKEEAAELKSTAVLRVRSQLPKMVENQSKLFTDDVLAYINDQVEQSVTEIRNN